jgi:4-hydroxy-4-methyl-2-oxoglutarate aldolase
VVDDVLCRRLERLESPAVADVLEELGLHHQVLTAAIRPVAPEMRVAGPAFCIRGDAISSGSAEPAEPSPAYELFRHMYPGCVAVIDTGGHEIGGPWGENTALSAAVRGCRGAVIDGGTRDGRQLAAMGFPTFARFCTPVRIDDRWRHVAFEQPLALPSQSGRTVTVAPGDLALADGDGVVIVPRDLGERVVTAAEEVVRIEERIRDELVRGVDREEVYRRNPRFAHVQ